MPVQVKSIDNHYLVQYLRYGLPGRSPFLLFGLAGAWNLAREAWARDGPLSDLAAGLFGAFVAILIMLRGVALSPDFGFTWLFVAGLAASMRARRSAAASAPPYTEPIPRRPPTGAGALDPRHAPRVAAGRRFLLGLSTDATRRPVGLGWSYLTHGVQLVVRLGSSLSSPGCCCPGYGVFGPGPGGHVFLEFLSDIGFARRSSGPPAGGPGLPRDGLVGGHGPGRRPVGRRVRARMGAAPLVRDARAAPACWWPCQSARS